jgi:hypothetical protein
MVAPALFALISVSGAERAAEDKRMRGLVWLPKIPGKAGPTEAVVSEPSVSTHKRQRLFFLEFYGDALAR